MARKMTLHKLVVLGDGGVGKTALIIQVNSPLHLFIVLSPDHEQLCLGLFVESYDPTINDSYGIQVMIDGHPCILEIFDSAGRPECTTFYDQRNQWTRDGDGFILVYSITSRNSFTRILELHSEVKRLKQLGHPNTPILLVGNKSDKDGQREISAEEGQALAKDLGCEFAEVSAKNFHHTEKAFYDVVRQLRRWRQVPTTQINYKGLHVIISPNGRNDFDSDYPPMYCKHKRIWWRLYEQLFAICMSRPRPIHC